VLRRALTQINGGASCSDDRERLLTDRQAGT